MSVINTNVCHQIQLLQKDIKSLWNIAAHVKLGVQRLLSIKNCSEITVTLHLSYINIQVKLLVTLHLSVYISLCVILLL
jgi:hypothetical protein